MIGGLLGTAFLIVCGLSALWSAWAALRRRNAYVFGWTVDRARKPFRYWLVTSVFALMAIYCLLLGSTLTYLILAHFTG